MLTAQLPFPAEPLQPIFNWLVAHPLIPAIALPIIVVGSFYLWNNKVVFSKNISGQPLNPLGVILKRALRIAYKEDKNPVVNTPEKLAQKLSWLTWTRYSWLMVALTLIHLISPATTIIPHKYGYLAVTILITIGWFALAKHIKTVVSIRQRILMQMFDVACSEMKYDKGSELNPWGYVQILGWENLYTPQRTVIMYPPKYRSEERRNQEAFERNFNGTVSDQHTWVYKWESANNRVIADPVPYIPTHSPYPFPDNKPWNIFPLGEAAGGKEAYCDIKVFPHMLIAGTTGSGKANSLNTPVPVPVSSRFPDGWATIGALQVGDDLFDENGRLCHVTGLSNIDENPDLYEVVFSDGSIIEADAEHLWWTEDLRARRSRRSKFKPMRRCLVSKEGKKRLEKALLEFSEESEITRKDLADIALSHNKKDWLSEVCKEVGHVGEIQIEIEKNTSDRIVQTRQKAIHYPAHLALDVLSNYTPTGSWKKRNLEVWKERQKAFKQFKQTLPASTKSLSVQTLANCAKMSSPSINSILKEKKVTYKVIFEDVEKFIPSYHKIVKGPIVKTYNAQNLIKAALRRIELPANAYRKDKVIPGVRTTLEILETLYDKNGVPNHYIPVAESLELPEQKLPISPYLYGCWLGDGRSDSGQICGIDHEMVQYWKDDGYTVTEQSAYRNGSSTNSDFRIWRIKGLTTTLRKEGLLKGYPGYTGQKRIPPIYMRGSIKQRKAFLAGMLDTDGDVSPNGQVRFRNTNRAIVIAVTEVARSLGHKPTMSEGRSILYGEDKGPVWTVVFRSKESPFFLTRKTKVFNERNTYNAERNKYHKIINIRNIKPKPARCLMVDSPSRLFLVSNAMIPTHNSVTQRTILLHILQNPDWRAVLLDPKG